MTKRKHNQEDLWDFICSELGFDEKGMEIQNAIRLYIKTREDLKEKK